MVSVTFQYYAKCMNGSEELELLVANNQDNKKIIKRLKDNPKLYDNVWLTRHATSGSSESNRCTLCINTTGFTEEQMIRGRWKKVIALKKVKTETIVTTEDIISNDTPKIETDCDKWWRLMNIPLMDISNEDLEWAAKMPYNSYCSKNGFLSEIERRKNL